MNNGSGVVGTADHFDSDHTDTFCYGGYSNIDEVRGLSKEEKFQKLLSVKVEVTQHAGVDSDKWLLHELDMEFRTYYGIPGDGYAGVPIDGKMVLEFGSAGWDYRWVSGNKVIKISYHDAQMTKPEPLEVVKAYLAKHPSSIKYFSLEQLRSPESITRWIKDEMERRLWLCDKWSMQLQLGKATQSDMLEAVVKHMKVFLNYRQKYFGISATNDVTTLGTALRANDGTTIKNKHSEYKLWWNAHKGTSISLP